MSQILETIGDFHKLLLVYRAASDLNKHSLPSELVPHYLWFLGELGGPKSYFSYYWDANGPRFKESPIRDLVECGDLATNDGKYHFLTPKGVKYTEELLNKAPETYETIKRVLPHLIKIESELPFLSMLLSSLSH
jgi:hypothetical protein